MGKSLYSLILSDEVIRKIDVLAHRSGTNRSNYINQILAEHASITTPERRINDIFGLINEFFGIYAVCFTLSDKGAIDSFFMCFPLFLKML